VLCHQREDLYQSPNYTKLESRIASHNITDGLALSSVARKLNRVHSQTTSTKMRLSSCERQFESKCFREKTAAYVPRNIFIFRISPQGSLALWADLTIRVTGLFFDTLYAVVRSDQKLWSRKRVECSRKAMD
jgi:hypothetical protein